MVKTWQDSFKSLSDKIDGMLSDFNDVKTRVTNLETSIQTLNTNTESDTNTTRKIDNLDSDVKVLKSKYDSLSMNIEQLQDKLIQIECQSRRDNLIIDGIPETPQGSKESPNECLEKVYDILENKMKLENARQMKIVRCHRLGAPPKSTDANVNRKPRSMIFKLHWFGDRQLIWKAKTVLKGTELFLREDFPREIQERRKVLLPIMHMAINKGYKAYILVDKLHLDVADGKHLIVDHKSLGNLPRDIDPEYATTRSNVNTLVFFNKLCPLSNFYDSPFTLDGRNFDTVERYYQLARANAANNETLAYRIENASTPAECKSHGDKVRFTKEGLSKWNRDQLRIMKAAVTAKFTQNDNARKFLLATGQKHLGEASPHDTYWGTGVGLRSPSAANQNSWRGKNKLGELLMQLRTEMS
jgi:ribA/ribD-fused uncharacterized protein